MRQFLTSIAIITTVASSGRMRYTATRVRAPDTATSPVDGPGLWHLAIFDDDVEMWRRRPDVVSPLRYSWYATIVAASGERILGPRQSVDELWLVSTRRGPGHGRQGLGVPCWPYAASAGTWEPAVAVSGTERGMPDGPALRNTPAKRPGQCGWSRYPGGAMGRRRVKTDPSPSSLWTEISPPIWFARRLLIARPRPAPL